MKGQVLIMLRYLKKCLFIFLAFLLFIGNGIYLSSSASGDSGGEIVVFAPGYERFIPQAKKWDLHFSLINTSSSKRDVPLVSLKKITVDGKDLDIDKVQLSNGNREDLPVVPAGRYIGRQELLMAQKINQKNASSRNITTAEKRHFFEIGSKIDQLTEKAKKGKIDEPGFLMTINNIEIPTDLLEVEVFNTYTVEATFYTDPVQDQFITFITKVSVIELPFDDGKMDSEGQIQSFPSDARWIPGDLHLHTNKSDGERSLVGAQNWMTNRGYRFIYPTDGHHTGELLPAQWSAYQNDCANLDDPSKVPVFPGVETSALDNGNSHLLIYGTDNNITGLQENTYSHQNLINRAVNKNSPRSSAAIAHPVANPLIGYPWTNWSVSGYSGIELMSGCLQSNFHLTSGAGSKYREVLISQYNNASTLPVGPVPSPRAGTDLHFTWAEIIYGIKYYVTWVYNPSSWSSQDYYQKKETIDMSLAEGRTIASRHGSLGYFTLGVNGKHIIGDVLTAVQQGTVLPLRVVFRPIHSGNLDIYIYRQITDTSQQQIFHRNINVTPWSSRTWNTNITITDPGSYWLYAKITSDEASRKDDYIYSAPIAIRFIDGLLGDVNGDGVINVTDSNLVLQYTSGLIELTEDELDRADVNGDGVVNATDGILILRYIVGLIDEFPRQ